jgi:tetratricopeptide (TPR) repeat protein
MGDLEQARSLLEDNLKFRLEILDSDHPQIAVAKNPLAALLIDLKEYEEAKKLAEESVALRLEVLSEEHPYIGFAHDTLALAELGLGDLVAAEYNAKISLERRIKFLGKDHFHSAVGHMTLAKIFSAQNRRKEAMDEAQKAHNLYMAGLRYGHPFQKKAAALLQDLKKSMLEGSEICR